MAEIIEIIALLTNKVSKTSTAVVQSIKTMNDGIQRITTSTYKWGIKSKVIPKILEDMRSGIITQEEGIKKLNASSAKLVSTQTKQTKGLHKFKMEWLGVMFAGMALWRVFSGLIKTQAELFGWTEMFGATMTLVMLPVMEAITPWLIKFLEFFMNLSPGVKKAIGVFIILGAIIGGIMMITGQFALGIASVLLVLWKMGVPVAKLMAPLKALGSLIAGLGVTFLVVAAIIAVIVIGMYIAWKKNFLGMKDTVSNFIDGVKKIFSGLIKVISGILLIVKGLFTGNFEDVKDGIIKILEGLQTIILGIFKATAYGVKAIFTGIILVIYNLIKVVVDSLIWAYNKTAGFLGLGKIAWEMPSLQAGGVIPATGPYFLHKGETVIPAGGGAFEPTISITASVASDYDVRILADRINEYLAPKYEAMMKGRGSI